MTKDYFTSTEADAGEYERHWAEPDDDDRPSPSDLAEPRIPEPSLWGVVEAGVKQHDERLMWVRLGRVWQAEDLAEYDRSWDELIDPALIREGIR